MNVAQVIEALIQFPPETPVIFWSEGCWAPVNTVEQDEHRQAAINLSDKDA
jgi:hypothetical protein